MPARMVLTAVFICGQESARKGPSLLCFYLPASLPALPTCPPHTPYRRGFAAAPILGRQERHVRALSNGRALSWPLRRWAASYPHPRPCRTPTFFLVRFSRPVRATLSGAFLSTIISATLVHARRGFAARRIRPNEYRAHSLPW